MLVRATSKQEGPIQLAGPVLIVDDEPAVCKVLATLLSQAGVRSESAADPQQALHLLQTNLFEAVISDLRMGTASGFELLQEVRSRFPNLPFLMATGVDDVRVGVQAMKQGADDYLLKPFDIDLVLASIHRALERKNLQRELDNYRLRLEEMVSVRTRELQAALAQLEHGHAATLEALGCAIDLRDGPTAGHSKRVLAYSLKIAQELGGLENQLRTLAMGAWLHDIGKLGIPDSILLKPGALSADERRIMERHVEIGYDLVKPIPFLADAAAIILAHHERYDGSGYPHGLRGERIPIGGRIFAVADSFDAMTSDRPYRSAFPLEKARGVINAGRLELFDPRIVDVFLAVDQNAWETIRADEQSASMQKLISAKDSALPPSRAVTYPTHQPNDSFTSTQGLT